jgi:SAM-dependent methyltransferase
MSAVAWHELECHGYEADMALWMELADREAGPVLDVGAGTGRVARALSAMGHDVTALDIDGELLAAIDDPHITCVQADAQAFDLEGFGLVIVPMQTLQLLSDRGAFFACARRALVPGGLLAAAVADELVPFEGVGGDGLLPEPDVGEFGGRRFVSQPTAVHVNATHARIERLRTVDGVSERNTIELALIDPPALAVEARAAGLHAVPGERIQPTDDHVGSSVVMFR